MTVEPVPQDTRSRRWLLRLGVLLLVAGLVILGWVGWQLFGTNVVAKHHAGQVREETKRAWAKGKDGPATALLHIPRFGRSYEVPIIDGFSDAVLARGVGRYPRGAEAGQVGNYVRAGHRITHGEPFSKFPTLRPGDLVEVETRTATYVYRLRNSGTSITVPLTTAWPLWPVPAPDQRTAVPRERLITLVTCSELFHTDNRSVAIGELVRTERPTGR